MSDAPDSSSELRQQPPTAEKGRDAVIIRTSVIGIIANVLLAAFKAAVGLASNSIAIVMDAVNNISDAASSVITCSISVRYRSVPTTACRLPSGPYTGMAHSTQ